MSGASLATGPRARTGMMRAPGELQEQAKEEGFVGGMMGSLRVIELQLVAFIVVFSASGLVPILDLIFPIFTSLYLYLLSVFVFPIPKRTSSQEIFRGNRLFQVYVILGTVVGLFLPLAFVLGGFARGDQPAVRAATPHLFLLSFQILSENIIRGFNIFSLPVRVLLPILYNARRLFSLTDWLRATFIDLTLPPNPRFQDVVWMWFARGLSAANFLYFGANLLAFLLPSFLPKAFALYFKDREEEQKARSRGGTEKRQEHVNEPPPTTQQGVPSQKKTA